MKKKYVLFILLFLASILLLRLLSINITLVINGYNPFNYSEYRNSDEQTIWGYGINKNERVIKVYKNEKTSYLVIGRNKFGFWEITNKGEYHNSDIQYNKLTWIETSLLNYEDDFTVNSTQHILYVVLNGKDNTYVNELPKNIEYKIVDDTKDFIVEVYTSTNGTSNEKTNLFNLEMHEILTIKD